MINLTTEVINGHDERELYLLLKIALRLYENPTCWPSNETLQKDTGWSKNTVLKYRDRLEEKGSISVNERFQKNGRQTSNEYRVICDGLGIYLKAKRLGAEDILPEDRGSKNEPPNGVQNLNGEGSKNEPPNGVQNLNPNSINNKKSIKRAKKSFSPPSSDQEVKDFKNQVYKLFMAKMQDPKVASSIKGAKYWAVWEAEKVFDHFSKPEVNWKTSGKKIVSISGVVSGWFKRSFEKGLYSNPGPGNPDFKKKKGYNSEPDISEVDTSFFTNLKVKKV